MPARAKLSAIFVRVKEFERLYIPYQTTIKAGSWTTTSSYTIVFNQPSMKKRKVKMIN